MGEDTIYFSDLLSTLICWAIFLILIGGGIMGYIQRAAPLQMPGIIQDLKDDKIQLGYIDDNAVEVQVVDEVSNLKEQVQLLKLQKELKQLQKDLEGDDNSNSWDEKVYNECVQILVSLGEKKSEARRKTAKIFQSNPNITLEQFVKKVYQA
tara:strand:+ start:639 stop:1094 length:456 start_codon:yes stop_codon:yes gene_type:complete